MIVLGLKFCANIDPRHRSGIVIIRFKSYAYTCIGRGINEREPILDLRGAQSTFPVLRCSYLEQPSVGSRP